MKSLRLDFRIILLPILALFSLAIYAWNLQPLYAYIGMRPIRLNAELAVVASVWIILAISVLPAKVSRPSDLFLLFYVMACFFWGSVLWAGTGVLSVTGAAWMMMLLYLPALAIKATQRFLPWKVRALFIPIYLFERSQLVLLIGAILGLGAIVALVSYGPGDFGLENVYERRLAGRDAISGSALAGYVINMTTNGVAPLLGFIAGYRRSPAALGIALAFVLLLFWQIGVKAPFVNVAILFAIGFAFSLPSLRNQMGAVALLGLACVFGFVAWEVSDGAYSLLADYLIRRVVMVQPEVQSYYVDLWRSLPVLERLYGVALGEYSDVTYMIGHTYLQNTASNANTNGFLYELLKGGIFGYLVAVAVVCAILVALDGIYEQSGTLEFVGIGGLYGILVSEQSYTAALVSSGIGLCFMLVMLCAAPPSRSKTRSIG